MSALTEALAKARKEMSMPPLNGVGHAGRNGSREYKYALLSDVLKCVMPPLLDNGVFLYQSITCEGCLKTIATMGDEELVLDSRKVNLGGTSQEQGSAETYAKRYALCTVFCIAGMDDDDGEAASSRTPPMDERTAVAKKRMWSAVKRWAELHGKDPMEIVNGQMQRPDWSDTAEFYDRMASEFEADSNV